MSEKLLLSFEIVAVATKRLYAWSWAGTLGGYNQCYATSMADALEQGNEISETLFVRESTLRLVEDVDAYWSNIPLLD